jgi:hypothetical protein
VEEANNGQLYGADIVEMLTEMFIRLGAWLERLTISPADTLSSIN